MDEKTESTEALLSEQPQDEARRKAFLDQQAKASAERKKARMARKAQKAAAKQGAAPAQAAAAPAQAQPAIAPTVTKTAPTGVAAMGKAAPQENAQEIMTLKQDIAGRVSQAVGAMDNISQFIAPLQQSTDPADKKVAQWIEDVEDKLEFLATQLEQYGAKGPR